jgi:plasmid stabilization system protein ParE
MGMVRLSRSAQADLLEYLVDGGGITIVRVLHHARDVEQFEF